MTKHLKHLLASGLLMTSLGCGADDAEPERGIAPEVGFTNLVGALAENDGAQTAGAIEDGPYSRLEAIQNADTVAIWSVRDRSNVLATAPIEANGLFTIEGMHPADGPFVIEAQANGDPMGSVLVLGVQGGTEFTVVMPISTETTIEVQAYLSLVDQGVAIDTIDLAGLTERITRQMATRVIHGEDLAPGVWAAQKAFMKRLRDEGVAVNSAEIVAARANAYNELAAQIGEGRRTLGWIRFRDISATAFSDFGADLELQAQATHVAAFALRGALPTATIDAVDALTACDFAEFEGRAHVAMAESIEGMSSVAERIESEYASYMRTLRGAGDRAAIIDARRELTHRLVGGGENSLLGAAMAQSMGADALRFPDPEQLPALMAQLDERLAEPRAMLQEELAQRDTNAALTATAEFRAEAAEALREVFGTAVEDDITPLAVSLMAAAELNVSGFSGTLPTE